MNLSKYPLQTLPQLFLPYVFLSILKLVISIEFLIDIKLTVPWPFERSRNYSFIIQFFFTVFTSSFTTKSMSFSFFFASGLLLTLLQKIYFYDQINQKLSLLIGNFSKTFFKLLASIIKYFTWNYFLAVIFWRNIISLAIMDCAISEKVSVNKMKKKK